MKTLNKTINPSQNTNPFNHDTNYIKLYNSVKDGTSGDKDEFGQLINPQYLDDVFNFVTWGIYRVRRVRIEIPRTEWLNLREVQVFDLNNTNVALNKIATQSSEHNPQVEAASEAVDGNLVSFSHTGYASGKYHISACE